MNLRRIKKKSFLESASASDIAFLLIIYFLVTAGFTVSRGLSAEIPAEIPAKNSAQVIPEDDLLRFELDKAGAVMYQGEGMDRAGAEGVIRAAMAERPNLALLLTVQGGAPWQAVVSFVDLAQKLEVNSFSFTMKEGDGGEGGI